MQTKTIEGSYLEFIERTSEVFQHKLEISRLGEHVTKNTWLCAAAYFWNRMKAILLINSDAERNLQASAIKEEIEKPYESAKFKEFYSTCFPDMPELYLATFWKCSGRAVRDIGAPILALKPSEQRTMLIKGLEAELAKLQAIWTAPMAHPGNN